jgi:hypothetical protein
MADALKSVLLVDFDSVRRSLAATGDPDAQGRFSLRAGEWLAAIASRELFPTRTGGLRSIEVKRCYAGTAGSGQAGSRLGAAGFEMVIRESDTSADVDLAVDAMDAAMDAGESAEFILMTAAPDLTSLAERLKARGHTIAIFADEATSADYRAAADIVLSADDFVAWLNGEVAPARAASTTPEDRAKIEAFAREIHGATGIPLFSPKTFGEVFRYLADEVGSRGYHFQDTAKNVADKLNTAGRNVTGRQVVFVVKGLALKGHVFSTSDTPRSLAEVFREQARYLIGNAGVALDAEREALLAAWITAPAAPLPPSARPAPKPVAAPAAERPARKPVATKPSKPEPKPAPKLPERPKSAALPQRNPPAQAPARQQPKQTSPDVRAQIAARIAASAKMKPSAKPAAPRPAPKPLPPPGPAPDPIESSILAAIAEAVDVLDEDSSSTPSERPPAQVAKAPPENAGRQVVAQRQPEPAPADDLPPPEEGSGDIGDEIQRIVASYNRNRKDGDEPPPED